jgi:hypothetical protein
MPDKHPPDRQKPRLLALLPHSESRPEKWAIVDAAETLALYARRWRDRACVEDREF